MKLILEQWREHLKENEMDAAASTGGM